MSSSANNTILQVDKIISAIENHTCRNPSECCCINQILNTVFSDTN